VKETQGTLQYPWNIKWNEFDKNKFCGHCYVMIKW